MPFRILLPLLLAALALAPAANADFVYDVTSNVAGNFHVRFDLPIFQQTINEITTLDVATWDNSSPLTTFSISGGSANCVMTGAPFSPLSGPCFIAGGPGTILGLGSTLAFTFNGPGTFTATDGNILSTLTITEVASVPEPATIVLLSIPLTGVGLLTRKHRY